MSPEQAVKKITEAGLTQSRIVLLLKAEGVETTQETVSRIGSGAIKKTSFEIGDALVKLAMRAEQGGIQSGQQCSASQ